MNRSIINSPAVCVYVIAPFVDGDPVSPVKIGVTRDCNARLREMQTGNHEELGLVAFVRVHSREVAHAIERASHEHLAQYSRRGEWFDVDPLTAARVVAGAVCTAADCLFGGNEDAAVEYASASKALEVLQACAEMETLQ